VNLGEGSRARAHLLGAGETSRLAEDAALGNKENVLARELLLQLADKAGLVKEKSVGKKMRGGRRKMR
jgi:hypothetical protein